MSFSSVGKKAGRTKAKRSLISWSWSRKGEASLNFGIQASTRTRCAASRGLALLGTDPSQANSVAPTILAQIYVGQRGWSSDQVGQWEPDVWQGPHRKRASPVGLCWRGVPVGI